MIYPNLPTRALSIRQPWVWAILTAGKRIENRPRRVHYRGPICLHASQNKNRRCYEDAANEIFDTIAPYCAAPHANCAPRGGIIGTAEIVDCVEESDSPWFFGPYGLVLENVQPVDFIPVKGALGLFDWRKKLESAQ